MRLKLERFCIKIYLILKKVLLNIEALQII